MARPSLTIRKPRALDGSAGNAIVAYVEGEAGQRLRLYVSQGEDGIMRYHVEHDETVEALPLTNEVKVVRWYDKQGG
jgi:hypothetical protein